MKLCPQCDFIYEDDQRFCDMDGKELVHRPAPGPTKSRVTIPVAAPGRPAGWRSSGLAVAAVVVFVLAALVVIVYVARSRQMRARRVAPPPQSSLQVVDQTKASPAQSADLAQSQHSDPADQNPTLPANEQSATSSAADDSLVSTQNSSKTALAHSRLSASPVSAGAATANGHSPVIVRLTNGATIRADEAWEKREGVWYRQAGMVTFLKRSRVRSVERVAAQPSSTASVAAGSSSPGAGAGGSRSSNGASKQKPKNTGAHDQLRIAKLEPVNQKKPSRVSSFLRKTGNLIKKPFKF
jgi:hypothetical protein